VISRIGEVPLRTYISVPLPLPSTALVDCVICDDDDDADFSESGIGVYVVVGRHNGSGINVQHGNATTHSCIILLRRPTKLWPATQRQLHFCIRAIRFIVCLFCP